MLAKLGLYMTYGDLFAHPVTFRTYRRHDSSHNFKDYGSVIGVLLTMFGLFVTLGYLYTLLEAFMPPYAKDQYYSEELINEFEEGRFTESNYYNMSHFHFMPSISI